MNGLQTKAVISMIDLECEYTFKKTRCEIGGSIGWMFSMQIPGLGEVSSWEFSRTVSAAVRNYHQSIEGKEK